ncbi:MAG: hypothetical protein F7C81_03670 [Desulfurococcales archaeon]|nr:hypothetical protein [Desulfurococcales archaeon]
MNQLWLVALVLTVVQVVIAVMLALNYRSIKHTPIGKRLIMLAMLFLAQAFIAMTSYYTWASEGYGYDIAAPLTLITTASLVGLIILYDISRI